jgi:hypothetical protein
VRTHRIGDTRTPRQAASRSMLFIAGSIFLPSTRPPSGGGLVLISNPLSKSKTLGAYSCLLRDIFRHGVLSVPARRRGNLGSSNPEDYANAIREPLCANSTLSENSSARRLGASQFEIGVWAG